MEKKQATTCLIAFILYIDKLRFRQGEHFDLVYPESNEEVTSKIPRKLPRRFSKRNKTIKFKPESSPCELSAGPSTSAGFAQSWICHLDILKTVLPKKHSFGEFKQMKGNCSCPACSALDGLWVAVSGGA